MIPKKIHYCWFGEAKIPKEFKNYIDEWSIIMPDFEIKLWNEANAPMDLPYMKKAFEHKKWANLSNYTRLHAVYEEGGIYLDTDVKVVKSFSDLLHNTCFFGLQTSDWDARYSFNNAVYGAEKNHRFIKKLKDALIALYDGTEEANLSSPHLTTYFLREVGYNAKYDLGKLKNGIQIYPPDYFFPYHWENDFDPDQVTKNTYAIHFWNGSWWRNIENKQKDTFLNKFLNKFR